MLAECWNIYTDITKSYSFVVKKLTERREALTFLLTFSLTFFFNLSLCPPLHLAQGVHRFLALLSINVASSRFDDYRRVYASMRNKSAANKLNHLFSITNVKVSLCTHITSQRCEMWFSLPTDHLVTATQECSTFSYRRLKSNSCQLPINKKEPLFCGQISTSVLTIGTWQLRGDRWQASCIIAIQ